MKTNLFFVNKFIIATFLITSAYTFNMQHTCNDFYINIFPVDHIFSSNTDKQNSIIAANHNRNNTLLKLPEDILQFILALSIDTTKPLKNIIKPALLLSTTCKRFNVEQFLITMGKACKGYPLAEKNKAMKMLLKSMNDYNYHNRRHAALLLTYAGAENDAYEDCLLEEATLKSDKQMITALFENKANPNQRDDMDQPIFFSCKKLKIAQMFFEQSANLNARDDGLNPNILFACLCYNYPLELIKFYIENKVDVKIKGIKNYNLLHTLAAIENIYKYTIKDYIEIGILFIKTAPELLNALNDDGDTPLDIAKQELKLEKNTANQQKRQVLITLFEEYGGKTAKQLKQDTIKKLKPTKQQSTENFTCCICYSLFKNSENITNIPCKQTHTDKICLSCYESCLKFSDKCPLCRGTL